MITRFGHIVRTVGPGHQFVYPLLEREHRVSLAPQSFRARTNVAAADGVAVLIDWEATVHVVDPRQAWLQTAVFGTGVRSRIAVSIQSDARLMRTSDLHRDAWIATARWAEHAAGPLTELGAQLDHLMVVQVHLPAGYLNVNQQVASNSARRVVEVHNAETQISIGAMRTEADLERIRRMSEIGPGVDDRVLELERQRRWSDAVAAGARPVLIEQPRTID